jgi:hypothetical protein
MTAGLPGSPKVTTELILAIVAAGRESAVLLSTKAPCEYPDMTTLVFGQASKAWLMKAVLKI